jgi:hypothetical protein
MSWDTERQALQEFFISRWVTANLGVYATVAVPIEWEGVPEDTPANRAPFITMAIINGGGAHIVEVGSVHLVRNVGIVQHIVSTKLGGDGIAKSIATILGKIWQSKRLLLPNNEKITFRGPEIKVMGNVNGRYQVVVSAAFIRDEFCAVPVTTTWP